MSTTGDARVVSGRAGLGTLLRAALPAVPVLGLLPGVRKSTRPFEGMSLAREPVTVERSQVEAYAAVCGFPARDVAPLTYPHLLAFGLHLAILADPAFPAPAIGTVHLENAISQHRPVAIGETLDVSTSVGPATPHPRGATYAFATSVYADLGAGRRELVWESTSTYLRRGGGDDGASWGSELPGPTPGVALWSLSGDLGRRYAAVSGDCNPIHLHPLTAKALGFRRQIAHGMWTLARCVAALENRLPETVTVQAAFRKPVFLPGEVAFGSRRLDGGYAFSLTKPGSETVHLLGRTTAL